jgi:hypothetical protein
MADGSARKMLHKEGDIGVIFAGSAVSATFTIETLAELMKQLQYVPGTSDASMTGLAKYMYEAYVRISKQVASTVLAQKGLSVMAVSGYCADQGKFRTFMFDTSMQNTSSMEEILISSGEFRYFGSPGAQKEAEKLAAEPNADHFSVLQSIIDDPTYQSVGGPIQSGSFFTDTPQYFQIYGSVRETEPTKYWYGGVDVTSSEMTINFISNISFRGT